MTRTSQHPTRPASAALRGAAGLAVGLLGCLLISGPAHAADTDYFERHVRPLLLKHCGECHGEEDPENGLTLTTVAGIAAGGSTGKLLIPGKPDRSRLIQAVRFTSKVKMPPDGKLATSEIAVLERWVRDGAGLPRGPAATVPQRRGHRHVITEADRRWWAFQPVRRPTAPEVGGADRVETAVDRFILRRLERRGITLSPPADRRTLVRRLSLDLLGLPPTPSEVDAFVHDPRPDAYERLVDRLLGSPQYGVRWGRHWLDIARYADTNGGGFDYVYPNAWRYRDYVIRSFNSDKPYSRFLTEQLAGDLLPPTSDPVEHADRMTATGLLTLAPKGLGMQDKEQMAMDVVDDQIDVLGRSLLGITLSCSRCHDHKFDPILTADYYALAGIFRSTHLLSDTDKNPSYWPEQAVELPSVAAARKSYQSRKAANAKATAEVRRKAAAELTAQARNRVADYLWAAVQLRQTTRRTAAVAHWSFDEIDGEHVAATAGPDGVLANAGSGAARPRPNNGRLGGALRFSGQQDVVRIEAKQLDVVEFGLTTDFSVAFWLRAAPGYSPQTADTLLAARYSEALWFVALRPGGFNGIYLRHYDGKRTVDVKPNRNRLPQLVDQQWHHVAFTSDRGGSARLFIDGEPAGVAPISAVSSKASYSRAESLLIGPSTNRFRGDLDDVAIWSRLLSPAEVKGLFQAGMDAQQPRNVAQVEKQRSEKSRAGDSQAPVLTYAGAAKQGLLPSVLRRFVNLLSQAEGDPQAALAPLIAHPPASAAELTEWVTASQDKLNKLWNDKKSGPFVILDKEAMDFSGDATKARLAELARQAEAIEQDRVEDPIRAMVAADAQTPRDLRVHIAGDLHNLGDVVPRGFPRVLGSPAAIPAGHSGRLELARWLTNSDHPLTARVFVNRLWQWHFGEGLVRTSDNFGQLGERPSHPELLDWLAAQLVDSGWSVKQLQRQIVLSAAYRQQSGTPRPVDRRRVVPSGESRSAADIPEADRLLWRWPRRRLEGEALRDAMLLAAGQLDLELGGTVNTWKPKMFSVDDANRETANYDTRRRSVFLPVVRGAAVHEMLQLFDFGDPNSITSRRGVTTVATQALFLMNSPFVRGQAKQLAERLLTDVDANVDDRIRQAYRICLAREPSVAEQGRAVRFLNNAQPATWHRFCHMLLCLNEFAYIQ